jgi:hypothetical protein
MVASVARALGTKKATAKDEWMARKIRKAKQCLMVNEYRLQLDTHLAPQQRASSLLVLIISRSSAAMPLHYPQIYNMTFDVFNKCQKT